MENKMNKNVEDNKNIGENKKIEKDKNIDKNQNIDENKNFVKNQNIVKDKNVDEKKNIEEKKNIGENKIEVMKSAGDFQDSENKIDGNASAENGVKDEGKEEANEENNDNEENTSKSIRESCLRTVMQDRAFEAIRLYGASPCQILLLNACSEMLKAVHIMHDFNMPVNGYFENFMRRHFPLPGGHILRRECVIIGGIVQIYLTQNIVRCENFTSDFKKPRMQRRLKKLMVVGAKKEFDPFSFKMEPKKFKVMSDEKRFSREGFEPLRPTPEYPTFSGNDFIDTVLRKRAQNVDPNNPNNIDNKVNYGQFTFNFEYASLPWATRPAGAASESRTMGATALNDPVSELRQKIKDQAVITGEEVAASAFRSIFQIYKKPNIVADVNKKINNLVDDSIDDLNVDSVTGSDESEYKEERKKVPDCKRKEDPKDDEKKENVAEEPKESESTSDVNNPNAVRNKRKLVKRRQRKLEKLLEQPCSSELAQKLQGKLETLRKKDTTPGAEAGSGDEAGAVAGAQGSAVAGARASAGTGDKPIKKVMSGEKRINRKEDSQSDEGKGWKLQQSEGSEEGLEMPHADPNEEQVKFKIPDTDPTIQFEKLKKDISDVCTEKGGAATLENVMEGKPPSSVGQYFLVSLMLVSEEKAKLNIPADKKGEVLTMDDLGIKFNSET